MDDLDKMDKYFVPYQPSLDMKLIEFDEPCLGLYHIDGTFYSTSCKSHEQYHGQICLAPLYQQAFDWFMEKHNLFGCVDLHTSMPSHWYFRIDDIIANDYVYHSEDELFFNFKTYKEAQIACLNKLIQIVKYK
jgi:hypothetical protein